MAIMTVSSPGHRMMHSLHISAGGPGSGRKKEMEDHLETNGFRLIGGSKHPAKASFWTKRIDHDNKDDTRNGAGNHTNHFVAVHPDGKWEHTSEGNHQGEGVDSLTKFKLHAAAHTKTYQSGTTLVSLKRLLAEQTPDDKKAATKSRKSINKEAIRHKKQWPNQLKVAKRDGLSISDPYADPPQKKPGTVQKPSDLGKTMAITPKAGEEILSSELRKLRAGGTGSGPRPGESHPHKGASAVEEAFHKLPAIIQRQLVKRFSQAIKMAR